MTSPRRSKKGSLGALIGAALKSGVADAEPSSQAWKHIERTVLHSTLVEADRGSPNEFKAGPRSRPQHVKSAHRPVV